MPAKKTSPWRQSVPVRFDLSSFANKDYRDGYLRTQIGSGIAYQIRALRAKLGFSQQRFAEVTGKTQEAISRIENSRSGAVTVRTLLDIAAGANVALLVQFVSYPEFLGRTENMSVAGLQPDTIHESLAKPQRDDRGAHARRLLGEIGQAASFEDHWPAQMDFLAERATDLSRLKFEDMGQWQTPKPNQPEPRLMI